MEISGENDPSSQLILSKGIKETSAARLLVGNKQVFLWSGSHVGKKKNGTIFFCCQKLRCALSCFQNKSKAFWRNGNIKIVLFYRTEDHGSSCFHPTFQLRNFNSLCFCVWQMVMATRTTSSLCVRMKLVYTVPSTWPSQAQGRYVTHTHDPMTLDLIQWITLIFHSINHFLGSELFF